jgi:hypothetical protein
MIAQGIKDLSIDELYLVYRDALQRIGAQVISGEPVDSYIEKQQFIVDAVQKKLLEREVAGMYLYDPRTNIYTEPKPGESVIRKNGIITDDYVSNLRVCK